MFRRLIEFLNRLGGSDSFESNQSFPALFMSILSLPFRLLFQFVAFMVTYWASSRSMKAFVGGLPALSAALLFLVAMVLASFLLDRRRVNEYRGHFSYQLNQAENPEMAAVYADKLVGLRPEEDRFRYQLGLARMQSNQIASAWDVMSYLANVKEYPDAQIWLARNTMNDETIPMSLDQRIEKSIDYYTTGLANFDPEQNPATFVDAHLGLAFNHLKMSEIAKDDGEKDSRIKDAITSLKKVTGQDLISLNQLDAMPDLIQCYLDTDQRGKAQIQLRNTIEKITPIAERFPDDVRFLNTIVRSCILMDEYNAAEKIIQSGFQLATTPQARLNISRMQCQMLIIKSDQIEESSNEIDYQNRLVIVSKAAISDPTSKTVYARLIEFAVPENEKPEQENWLRRTLVSSPTPGITHILLGLRAFEQGEILEGERHWIIAARQTRQAHRIINTLVDYAYVNTPERFDNLTDILSVAIDQFPNQFVYYITRGKIHLNELNYQLAVDDFEIAARTLPNSIVIREALAKAYGKLGNQKKSQENRELADELRVEIENMRMEVLERQQ